MPSWSERIKDATIPDGAQDSNWFHGDYDTGDAIAVAIGIPAGATATLTFQAQFREDGPVYTLENRDGSGVLSLPAAGQARVYFEISALYKWRLHASAAVGGGLVAEVHKIFQAGS